jgi:choline dehydrogenase-like flavoprotein
MDQRSRNWFYDTVSALAYSFGATHPGHPPPYNDIAQFVVDQHGRMPDYLRTPMLLATLGFDFLSLFKHRKFFHQLPPELRATQIHAWKNSKTGFKRDLIRYHESLSTLALYERNDGPPFTAVSAHPTTITGEQVISVPEREISSEIIVVGSGPGGAITACLLAEAGRQVLLVEEGEYLALDSCRPFSRDEMVQKYRHGGQTVAMGTNKVAYVEGRCVGGGSEINSGLYHRTPGDILEKWRKEFQVQELDEKDLLPHFEACERDVSVCHLPVPAPAASLKLHEGAQKLGWKSLEIPRWFNYQDKAGSAATGKRQSMTETFIPRFLKAGGKLLPRTKVAKLRQDGDRWQLNATHAQLGALRLQGETLFISAGAVQTPALLRRGGITQNIGNSLHLHPTIKVVAKFDETINSAQMGVPVHQVKEFSPRLSFGCSISSPAYLALALLDHPGLQVEISRSWPRMATYYAMITGEGHGTVRSVPGFRDPLVRYFLSQKDRADLADGLKKLSGALLASGAVELFPSTAQASRLKSPDDLSKLPEVLPSGHGNLMTIHLFSSCPMGEDQKKCAADSFGRLHGFKNLFVADASLLCSAPGVNPQGSIMALARRNALRYLNKS